MAAGVGSLRLVLRHPRPWGPKDFISAFPHCGPFSSPCIGRRLGSRYSRCDADRRGRKWASKCLVSRVGSASAREGRRLSHYSALDLLVLPVPSPQRINKHRRVTRPTQKQLHLLQKLVSSSSPSVNFTASAYWNSFQSLAQTGDRGCGVSLKIESCLDVYLREHNTIY